MAKSKWWQWVTNPIGSIVRNVTDGKGGSANQINALFNPVSTIAENINYKVQRKELEAQKLAQIKSEASELGMSLEEYLKAFPLKAEQYNRLAPVSERLVTKGKSAINELLENEHVEAAIENFTGERDTKENEKNRQFQSEEAEINRQWEVEQAQTAREWDSIGAQMERAAAAGVNPVSIAMQNGGINGSLGTSIPSAPSTPVGSSGLMHSGLPDLAGMVFNGIGTLAENRLKQTQADDITIMRKYNIAEKIANTDHLRELCRGVELSNTAQTIQNSWLDIMNQATYDNMLFDQGVKRSTILQNRSIASLNFQQIASVRQSMDLALKEFNAKLPLELQLMEAEITNTNMSTQDIYSEICMRYLQSIEQENRNRQSAADAEGAEIDTSIKRQTMEDSISAFHNSMLKGAAEAGISLNDYMYWSVISHNPTEAAGKAMLQFGELNNKRKNFGRKLFGRTQIPYYGIGERSNEMISW